MTSRALLVTVPVVHASAPTARAANPATVARAAAPRAARVHLRAYGRGWAVRRNPTPVCARATRAVSTAASIGAIAWPPSVDQSVCLDVPMDLYALLGGTKASLPDADAVLQAMVARLTKDDDEEDSGFTPTALATRTLLVEQAAACLSNQESRKAYEASLLRNPKASTPVPLSQVPGVLLLLQEAEQADTVLEVGTTFLETAGEEVDGGVADASLAMALAYCDLGGEAMDDQPQRIMQGCAALQAAITLLRAPELQRNAVAVTLLSDLDTTLQELAPTVVLEVLAAPITGESMGVRAGALAELQALLWQSGDQNPNLLASRAARADLMKKAYPLLTAAELVRMNSEAPTHIPAEPKEVFNAALAGVAAAFQSGDASLLLGADDMLQQLQEAQVGREEKQDVTVERALIQLLLGNVDTSMDLLALDDPAGGDAGVKEFVRGNAGEDGDVLAGVLALLEQWMMEAVLPNFRDTQPLVAGLSVTAAWFDNPAVQASIESLDIKRSPLSQAGTMVQDASSAVTGAVTGAVAGAMDKWQLRGEGVRPKGLAVGFLVVGVVAAAATTASYMLTPGGSFVGTRGVSSVAAGLTGRPAAGATASPLSESDARSLVDKWQRIKAQALGGKHHVGALEQILDGYMLSQWKGRAQDVKQHGWYWDYTLVGLKIDSVVMAEGNTKAVVQATLQEAAQLYDRGRPDNNDAYRSTYCARYELNWKPDVGWRIVSGAVLY